ncbi:glycyl-radical enzyme activating protein [Diplocloster modestus]|uniref:Glycyl-radical enzyme activating protein n=1 Tax=Diplocloster modestus TaxID=2850322 RepID=A0ABS6KB23_9FIRM|nr:glycyl-radical enzyme activating protein [Diplocloster modestus]MBU9727704.1 glycyl-radical enzyme activating protein [Diplocloster modestus]
MDTDGKGIILQIQKFSIHDGPGIRTTVFLKGCNLRCRWCANPESQICRPEFTLDRLKCVRCGRCVENCGQRARTVIGPQEYPAVDPAVCTMCLACEQHCPQQAIGHEGRLVTAGEVAAEAKKDKPFYDHSGGGVTLSGGEVLMQREFTISLCRKLHEQGIHVAVETAAAVPSEQFQELLREVDYLFVDMKHYDSVKHREGTGVGNEQVLQNIEGLQDSNKPFRIRIPVIPGFNDSAKDAKGFAQVLNKLGVPEVQLLPFHQMGERKYELLGREYTYQGKPQLHPEDLEAYRGIFEKYHIKAQIGA